MIIALMLSWVSDLIYDFIGNRRYRWFGKIDSCWLPTDQLAKRFVDLKADIHPTELEEMLLHSNIRKPGC